MELTKKLLEQIAYNKRSRNEELMLLVMEKSTHEEHLYQPLQTNIKQLKVAVTFLTGYNGIFNITSSNNKFYFKKSFTNEDDFIQNTIPQGSYEIESLKDEIRRINIDKEHYTEANNPFSIKPIFSTLGSIIENSPQGPLISFVFIDSIRNLLGFIETILYQEYNISPNPVDNLAFDKIFLETDIARGMIFRGRRSGIVYKLTMDVRSGFKYIEKIRGGLQW